MAEPLADLGGVGTHRESEIVSPEAAPDSVARVQREAREYTICFSGGAMSPVIPGGALKNAPPGGNLGAPSSGNGGRLRGSTTRRLEPDLRRQLFKTTPGKKRRPPKQRAASGLGGTKDSAKHVMGGSVSVYEDPPPTANGMPERALSNYAPAASSPLAAMSPPGAIAPLPTTTPNGTLKDGGGTREAALSPAPCGSGASMTNKGAGRGALSPMVGPNGAVGLMSYNKYPTPIRRHQGGHLRNSPHAKLFAKSPGEKKPVSRPLLSHHSDDVADDDELEGAAVGGADTARLSASPPGDASALPVAGGSPVASWSSIGFGNVESESSPHQSSTAVTDAAHEPRQQHQRAAAAERQLGHPQDLRRSPAAGEEGGGPVRPIRHGSPLSASPKPKAAAAGPPGAQRRGRKAHTRLLVLTIVSFALSFVSAAVAIVDSEVCYWMRRGGEPHPVTVSVALKSLVMFLSVVLAFCTRRFYTAKIQTLKDQRRLSHGATLWCSQYYRSWATETAVALLHVPPMFGGYPGAQLFLPLVFLRLHLMFRLIKFTHPMFRDKLRLVAIAAFNRVRVDCLFTAKTLLLLRPFAVLSAALSTLVFFGAYAMEVFERDDTDHPGHYYWRWLRVLAGHMVGLEPPLLAVTVPGQLLELACSFAGVLLLAILIAVVAHKLELRSAEARVVEYLDDDRVEREAKNVAAQAIQEVWRMHAGAQRAASQGNEAWGVAGVDKMGQAGAGAGGALRRVGGQCAETGQRRVSKFQLCPRRRPVQVEPYRVDAKTRSKMHHAGHALRHWRTFRGRQHYRLESAGAVSETSQLHREVAAMATTVSAVVARVSAMETALRAQNEMLARVCQQLHQSGRPSSKQ